MAKEVTLQFVLKEDQVGMTFMKRVTEALYKAGVIEREDEVHLIGRTHSFIIPRQLPPSTPR